MIVNMYCAAHHAGHLGALHDVAGHPLCLLLADGGQSSFHCSVVFPEAAEF